MARKKHRRHVALAGAGAAIAAARQPKATVTPSMPAAAFDPAAFTNGAFQCQ